MNPKIEVKVRQHGSQLINLFNLPADTDPVKLCQSLHRLEIKATRISTDYCNGVIDGEKHEFLAVNIETKVRALFGNNDKFTDAFFINSDPRGYALKLRSQWTTKNAPDLHHDWGGYGILCPEFTA